MKTTGGHLIEFHLIESLDRNFLIKQAFDQNCVLSLDRNYVNHLTEFLDGFQLIESFNNDFGQTPKKLSLDRKFY